MSVSVLVRFIGLEREDGGNPQIVITCLAPSLERIVIGQQAVHAADAHDRTEMLLVRLAVVVGDDPVDNLFNALRVFEKFPRVDTGNVFINQRAILAAKFAPILDGEAQHVLVCNRVRDDVFVQAFCEQIFGRTLTMFVLGGILREDRRAREAEHLRRFKELSDRLVCLAKLAAVAFIENENDPLPAQIIQLTCMVFARDGRVQLLDRGHDQGRVA